MTKITPKPRLALWNAANKLLDQVERPLKQVDYNRLCKLLDEVKPEGMLCEAIVVLLGQGYAHYKIIDDLAGESLNAADEMIKVFGLETTMLLLRSLNPRSYRPSQG